MQKMDEKDDRRMPTVFPRSPSRVESESGSGRPTGDVSFNITGGSRFSQSSSVKGQPILKLFYSRVGLTPVLIIGVSLAIGYFLGGSTGPRSTIVPAEEDDGDDPTNVGEVPDGNLSAITPGLMEPCKMVRYLSPRSVPTIEYAPGTSREDRSENGKRENRSTVGYFTLFPLPA